MNTKTITITAMALLLVGAATAQTTETDPNAELLSSSNIQATLINTDPVPLQSGESGDLRFKIRNTGDSTSDVKVELIDTYPFQVKPDRKTEYSLGELQKGQEYQISTEVMVADDAPDGSNDFRARIETEDMSRTVNIPVEVQSLDIELNVANLQTQPQQLMPDTDNNQLSIDLVNNGEKTAENVILKLETPGFFQKTSSFSTRKSLGNIPPGDIKTASFNFDINETASKGLATLNTSVSYTADDSTTSVNQEESFQMYVEGKPQFEITDVESQLKTGSTRQLRLEVTNQGEEESSFTKIRVMDSSDQPFSYESSSQYIGTLEPGQSGEAVFEVETEQEANVKDYLIDFETRGVKGTEVFVEDETVEATVENGTDESGSNLPIIVVAVLILAALAYYFREKIWEILP
jgi:hypothetical protein